MNPIKQRISDRLSEIDAVALEPLVTICQRYLRFCSAVDPSDETLMIAHEPWRGSEAYALRVFPRARKSWFSKYSRIHGLTIPVGYRAILTSANGVHAFGLSLYGMSPSMLREPPLLDRSRVQCLDLSGANAYWKRSFPGQEEHFHFGGRHWSQMQDSGYFWDHGGEITAVLKTGDVVGRWPDFRAFLSDELEAAEQDQRSQIPEEWWQ